MAIADSSAATSCVSSELAFGAISLPLELAVFDEYFNDPSSPMRCVVVTDATATKAAKGEQAIAFVKGLASRNTDTLVFNGSDASEQCYFLTPQPRRAAPETVRQSNIGRYQSLTA